MGPADCCTSTSNWGRHLQICTLNWEQFTITPQIGARSKLYLRPGLVDSDWTHYKTKPPTRGSWFSHPRLGPLENCTSDWDRFRTVSQIEAGLKVFLRLGVSWLLYPKLGLPFFCTLRLGPVQNCTSNWGMVNAVHQNVVTLIQPGANLLLYIKLGPVHAHSRSMSVPPPPKVLRVTGCSNGLAQVSVQGLKPEWRSFTVFLVCFILQGMSLLALFTIFIPRDLLWGPTHAWCQRRHVNLVGWS